MEPSEHVNQMLDPKAGVDARAARDLLPLVYHELRRHAQRQLAREKPGGTLDATALVHEAYLTLVGERRVPWTARTQFFRAASLAMRRILIDRGRSRRRIKRGGGAQKVSLAAVEPAASETFQDALLIDEAVCRMEKEWPDVARVVRLRFYAGMSVPETARALGVSVRTVFRDWTFARAWLIRELGKET